jgi:NAD-reducing hydrogenase small subunit
MAGKIKVATTSLAGCFGCHMSLLDIDERILDLVELVEFDRTPLADIKEIGACDVGIIEGGVANAENVQILREFRRQGTTLVAMGACAINGGIPDDQEIPLLLNKVHPIHEVVRIDHFLPGCPPSADTIWTFLTKLLEGSPVRFPYGQIRYD